ncbi:MAG: right-handed parallel beta-helix repeat-containing protein [Phycisphaerae bacterium]|nr:right-handed parallel beta-helix repeat-containing protein [Phycisphaerae bacterium]
MRFRAVRIGALVVIMGGLMFCQAHVEAESIKDSKSVVAVSEQKEPARTWVEIGGKIYGAKPDARGPIGGGAGYKMIVTKGDYQPRTLDGLLDALKKAGKGQVVYLAEDVEIDLTVRTYTEKTVIEIPEGVTLAGNRGQDGSPGAIIFSDAFQTHPMIRATGPNVRITGLRLRGPEPKRRLEHHRRSFKSKKKGRGQKYYYKFPESLGVRTEHPGLEIDNCELSGWSYAAIYLKSGDKHHIHHNYIHHNQYNGLGYGVTHNRAFSLIDYNLFNYNRHSIAGTGRSGSGYEAANNVELGVSLSHCFDMHRRDSKDGVSIGIAGDWMKIHHNTFRAPKTAILIRGLPQQKAEVYNNWFYHDSVKGAVGHRGKTAIYDNAYSLKDPKVEGVRPVGKK